MIHFFPGQCLCSGLREKVWEEDTMMTMHEVSEIHFHIQFHILVPQTVAQISLKAVHPTLCILQSLRSWSNREVSTTLLVGAKLPHP